MTPIARRAILGGGLAVVTGAVAAATLLRPGPRVLVLRHADAATDSEPAVSLQGMDAMVRTAPVKQLPPVVFRDASGATHTLADFAGKGIVLNLWATWCVPCVAELPSLAALAARSRPFGIEVLAVSVDRGGTAAVQRFFAAHGISGLGVWADPESAASRALGARGVPTTFVVDRQGREQGLLEGSADWGTESALATVRRLVG